MLRNTLLIWSSLQVSEIRHLRRISITALVNHSFLMEVWKRSWIYNERGINQISVQLRVQTSARFSITEVLRAIIFDIPSTQTWSWREKKETWERQSGREICAVCSDGLNTVRSCGCDTRSPWRSWGSEWRNALACWTTVTAESGDVAQVRRHVYITVPVCLHLLIYQTLLFRVT